MSEIPILITLTECLILVQKLQNQKKLKLQIQLQFNQGKLGMYLKAEFLREPIESSYYLTHENACNFCVEQHRNPFCVGSGKI